MVISGARRKNISTTVSILGKSQIKAEILMS
jgi:hypothetical protein